MILQHKPGGYLWSLIEVEAHKIPTSIKSVRSKWFQPRTFFSHCAYLRNSSAASLISPFLISEEKQSCRPLTNYHKYGWLKQKKLRSRSPRSVSLGQNQDVGRDLLPSEAQGEYFSLASSLWWLPSFPACAVSLPFLPLWSHGFPSSGYVICFCLSLRKTLEIEFRAHLGSLGLSPHVKILNPIYQDSLSHIR